MKVRELMSLDICSCMPNDTVTDVAKKMNEYHVGSIPVCDEGKNVVGIITDRDITLRCVATGKDTNTTGASEIMTTSVCCCKSDTDVQDATKLMADMQVRRIPVLEKDKLVGMLTVGDLANSKNVSAKEVSDTVENICKCGTNAKNNY